MNKIEGVNEAANYDLRIKIAKLNMRLQYSDSAPDGYNKKIVGWLKFPKDFCLYWMRDQWYSCFPDVVPDWTENINDAWLLFEEMAKSCKAHISYYDEEEGNDKWHCTTVNKSTQDVVTVRAMSAPLAICGAYIKWKQERNKFRCY
jgi:beta-xylosidase